MSTPSAVPAPDPASALDRSPGAALVRLVRYAEGYRGKILAASAWSVLNKLFDLAPPLLIGAAVDVVVKKEDSLFASWGIVDVAHQLYLLAVLTVIIWAAESVFEYAFKWAWRNLAQSIQHDLRLSAYGHIQDLDMEWFADRSRGGLMSVLNDDINQLERFLDGGANDILQVTTTAIAVSAVFFYLTPAVAVLALVPIPAIIWGSFLFQNRIAPRYAKVRTQVGLLNGILANNLDGIATIKSFVTEAAEESRVRGASEDYRVANRSAIAVSAAFSPLIRMVIVVGFTATLLVGGFQTLDGTLEVGSYSVLVFLTQRLLWPMTRLGETFDLYQRAMASTHRVLDLLDTPVNIVSGPVAIEPSEVRGEIVFDDIHFAYPEREPVFGDKAHSAGSGLSLRIPAGSTVAVVGATGSGKSTLIRLLLRFYEPQAGRITLDGTELDQLDLGGLRRSVAMVSQQTFLFPGSVADNVAYGRPGAPREDIVEAAEQAEALGFVEVLPQRFDTVVGESGQKLSGGQRQRLSIARAVLKDAPILVLDEATSAVDNETEAAIQRSLARISRDRTTIVIAHRLSTIRDADHIFVLDLGRLVEEGSHEALLDRDGIYSRLWRVQTGERLPFEGDDAGDEGARTVS